jgi:hypothetical protein
MKCTNLLIRNQIGEGEEGWSQDTKVGRNIALNPKNG